MPRKSVVRERYVSVRNLNELLKSEKLRTQRHDSSNCWIFYFASFPLEFPHSIEVDDAS